MVLSEEINFMIYSFVRRIVGAPRAHCDRAYILKDRVEVTEGVVQVLLGVHVLHIGSGKMNLL